MLTHIVTFPSHSQIHTNSVLQIHMKMFSPWLRTFKKLYLFLEGVRVWGEMLESVSAIPGAWYQVPGTGTRYQVPGTCREVPCAWYWVPGGNHHIA